MSATEPEPMQQENVYVPKEVEEMREVHVEKQVRSSSDKQRVQVERSSVSANQEAMTYKELVQVAKQKNISGTRNLSKSQVIDMIRRHDSGEPETETDLTELLSAQPDSGAAPLDIGEVDNSLGE